MCKWAGRDVGVGKGWGLVYVYCYIYLYIYMCVTKEMCKCTKCIHTFREHGHRLGRRPFRLRLFFLVVLGSHSCLAADGLHWIAVQSRRVSLEKNRRCRGSPIFKVRSANVQQTWHRTYQVTLRKLADNIASTWNSFPWLIRPNRIHVKTLIRLREPWVKPGRIQSSFTRLLSMELSQPWPPNPSPRPPSRRFRHSAP